MQVNGRWSAVCVGVATAIFLVALCVVRDVPALALAAIGAPSRGVARYGGVVVRYHTAGDAAPRSLELPSVDEAVGQRALTMLARGSFDLREVVESSELGKLQDDALSNLHNR